MKKKINTYWLYSHHNNLDSIFSALERADLPIDFEVKLFMLISSTNLFEELKKWIPKSFSVNFIEENDNLATIKLTKSFSHTKNYDISGYINLVRIGTTNVFVAISYESFNFVKKVVLTYFAHFYSNVSRLYISSNQIRKILDNLKEITEGEIATDRVVSYSRIDDKIILLTKYQDKILKENYMDIENTRKRTKESDLRWTYEDYTKSFQRAAENDQWIDKITFAVIKENHELFYGFLSRDGIFKCNKNLRLFFNTILTNVSKIGSDKIKVFKDKSRVENAGKIKPLIIEYSYSVFKDVEYNKRLIKVLSEFPKSSYSVYHGNPYVHLSLVDYCDGSSYDIWVLTDDKIIIVPQLKASFSSISRLCEHIFRKFREGEIKELEVK